VTAGDDWVVPLGRYCHHDAAARDGVHKTGDEVSWWERQGIDPIALAERLWAESEQIRTKGNKPWTP